MVSLVLLTELDKLANDPFNALKIGFLC